jgi:UDP-N-acetylmuramate dehydrogenase
MPNIQKNISLKHLNTFHVEAYAQYFVSVRTNEELSSVLKDSTLKKLPKFILGGGSNVLFTKDFKGLIIKISNQGIKLVKETHEHVWLLAAAGENWTTFVHDCIQHQYAGVENLFLIPGSLGAAIVQNAGAYGMETADTVQCVETINRYTGDIKRFLAEECQFSYRSSRFKTKKNPFIITHAVFKLSKKPCFRLDYEPLRQSIPKSDLTLQKIADTIVSIRQSKLPDYRKYPNAGSFFKNPVISVDQFAQLAQSYQHIPHWSYNSGVKIAAAWLIEQCGFKGKRFGNVGVYHKHALVLVNYGHANGKEIKALADHIVQKVIEKFNILLVSEVMIL